MPLSTPIRDAATVILARGEGIGRRVLMGQRGSGAAFMPGKFVFPGGAVDPSDHNISFAAPLGERCQNLLELQAAPGIGPALAAAAIRELWEETGLILGAAAGSDTPDYWNDVAESGVQPDASALTFVFRAITPPGRPRRFDARFFLADAKRILGDLDDFSRASDELSHLQWVPIEKARTFDLPFITQVVLAELFRGAGQSDPPETVPFFNNTHDKSEIRRLG